MESRIKYSNMNSEYNHQNYTTFAKVTQAHNQYQEQQLQQH